MVLSKRVTLKELVFKIPCKSQIAVVNVLDKLECKMGRLFSETFKTITCDNGCENLDFKSIEKSVRIKGMELKYIVLINTVHGSEAQMRTLIK
jgi:IS30 family transposase